MKGIVRLWSPLVFCCIRGSLTNRSPTKTCQTVSSRKPFFFLSSLSVVTVTESLLTQTHSQSPTSSRSQFLQIPMTGLSCRACVQHTNPAWNQKTFSFPRNSSEGEVKILAICQMDTSRKHSVYFSQVLEELPLHLLIGPQEHTQPFLCPVLLFLLCVSASLAFHPSRQPTGDLCLGS